jgi:hypothetical protein
MITISNSKNKALESIGSISADDSNSIDECKNCEREKLSDSSLRNIPFYMASTHFACPLINVWKLFSMVQGRLVKKGIVVNSEQNEFYMICGCIVRHEFIKFVISFFKRNESDVIIEFQRRSGCTIAFHEIYYETKRNILGDDSSEEDMDQFQSRNISSDDEMNVKTLDHKDLLQMILQLLEHKNPEFKKEGMLYFSRLADLKINILAHDDIKTALSSAITAIIELKNAALFLQGPIASSASLVASLSMNCETQVQEHNQQWILDQANILVMFTCKHGELGDIEQKTILLHLLRNGSQLIRNTVAKCIDFCTNSDLVEMINMELIDNS